MSFKFLNISYVLLQLFHEGGRYHIETSPLICSANQWTGFYMITVSIIKELKVFNEIISEQDIC